MSLSSFTQIARLQVYDVPAAQMAGALQRQECLFNIVENDGIASEPRNVVGQDVRFRSDIMHMVLSGHFADDDCCRTRTSEHL
jgi:hypothetical protein